MKKVFLLLSMVFVTLAFASCGGSNSNTTDSGTGTTGTGTMTQEDMIQKSESLAPTLIGMTPDEAEAIALDNGVLFRVVEQDGNPLPTTRDARPGRLNASVTNGVVTSISVEGSNNVYDTNPESPVGKMEANQQKAIENAEAAKESYIGLTPEEAQKKAEDDTMKFRVIEEDGKPMAVTLDYRPGRMNATTLDGKVSFVEVEGVETVYDVNSWKAIIPETCNVFSDGCNTCTRDEETGNVSCTRRACAIYERPTCLDGTELN